MSLRVRDVRHHIGVGAVANVGDVDVVELGHLDLDHVVLARGAAIELQVRQGVERVVEGTDDRRK